MELTFDPYSWRGPARDSGRGDAASISRLEWHALAARLAAAHAFQRHGAKIARTVAGTMGPMDNWTGSGSFHAETARVLAGFAGGQPHREPTGFGNGLRGVFSDKAPRAIGEERVLAAVNPTSSGDLKDTSGMVSTVAGPFPSGNRGLK